MATTKDYRLGEFTFPRGWFMIAESIELNQHRPLAGGRGEQGQETFDA